jgi:hypothetical protein
MGLCGLRARSSSTPGNARAISRMALPGSRGREHAWAVLTHGDLADVRSHSIETRTAIAEHSHHGPAASQSNPTVRRRALPRWLWHRRADEPHSMDRHDVRFGIRVNGRVGFLDVFGKSQRNRMDSGRDSGGPSGTGCDAATLSLIVATVERSTPRHGFRGMPNAPRTSLPEMRRGGERTHPGTSRPGGTVRVARSISLCPRAPLVPSTSRVINTRIRWELAIMVFYLTCLGSAARSLIAKMLNCFSREGALGESTPCAMGASPSSTARACEVADGRGRRTAFPARYRRHSAS